MVLALPVVLEQEPAWELGLGQTLGPGLVVVQN